MGFTESESSPILWFRKTTGKSINLPKLKSDLRNSELLLNTPNLFTDLVNCFRTTLKSIVDKYAPRRKRTIVQWPQAPWLSDEIRSANRLRRIAERNWKFAKFESDRRTFKLLRNKAFFLVNKSRCEFYTDFISNTSGDQCKLFAATKKLLNQSAELPFPLHSDKLALANDMGSFFIKEISDLRVSLDTTENSGGTINHYCSQCSSSFTAFRRQNPVYLTLFPLTSWKIDCLNELLPILSTMINLSLESGLFPDIWKYSVVTPLLKKQGLELVFRNFRPVSNLSFFQNWRKEWQLIRSSPT